VVDGDEVPSQALLNRLATLKNFSSRATHAYVQRRWVWPTAHQYITDDPWRDDPQLRIVKRDARILNWPTSIHKSPKVDGPGIHLPESLYHLDLLTNSLDVREDKVNLYETYSNEKHPGLGVSINRAYYLPEQRETRPQLKVVDIEDSKTIEQVLNTNLLQSSQTDVSGIEVVPASELATDASHIGYSITEHECSLSFVETPTSFSKTGPTRISIEVTNTGTWPYQPYRGDGGIALGWHLYHSDGEVWLRDAGRSPLNIALEPSESVVLQCEVRAPENLDTFTVNFDLVEEGYAWFNKPLQLISSTTETK
jgi:hypothetical protein